MRFALWVWLVVAIGFAGLTRGGAADEATNQTAVALEALSRLKGMDVSANPAVKAAVDRVLLQVRGRPEFVEIVREFQLTNQDAGLLEIAESNSRDASGVEAARLLLEHQRLDLLGRGLAGSNAVSLTESLGHAQRKEMLPLLMPLLLDLDRPQPLRREALRAIAQVQEGAATLLKLAAEHKIPPDLEPAAAADLNAVRWPELKSEAARVLPLPPALNSQPLPPISELLKRQGDARKGAEVFKRETVGCGRCHQVNGQGIDFGPNLSEIGSKLGADALYQAILEPSAGISFGYEAWEFEMKNGDEVYGLIASETAEEVLVKAVGGITSRYKKSDISRRTRQKVSAMPSGLEQGMTVDDLVDLVAYLGTLKKR